MSRRLASRLASVAFGALALTLATAASAQTAPTEVTPAPPAPPAAEPAAGPGSVASPSFGAFSPDAAPPAYSPPEPSLSGASVELRLGVLVPTGKFEGGRGEGPNLSAFGAGGSGTLRFAWYVTPSFALVAGVRGSTFHKGLSPCPEPVRCIGTTTQVPVMVRFTSESRQRGVFVEAGLGLLTSYSFSAKAGSAEMNATFSNDILEAKLGAGYRLPIGNERRRAMSGIEIFAGVDVGQFEHVDVSTTDGRSSRGDVMVNAVHTTFELGVGLYFLP